MQQNLIDAARAIGTKPVTGRYFLCLCSKCGWLGSSEECRLVEDPIFGDGEYFCAVCGASEPDEVAAAEAFNAMIAGTASRHPDDVAVDRFALAMKAKLTDARAKGRSGWDDPAQCSVEFLAQLLVGHLTKTNAGNFEDVANLAMMLHQRGADPSVLAEAAREKPADEPVAVPDDAWECLLDVVSHHQTFVDACRFTQLHVDGENVLYWKHQIDVLDRMKEQAERALTPAPTATVKDSLIVQQAQAARLSYFAYAPDVGFEQFNTEAEAIVFAQAAIDAYRDAAGDGWDEDVESVCWGVVHGTTQQVAVDEDYDGRHGLGEVMFVDYILTGPAPAPAQKGGSV